MQYNKFGKISNKQSIIDIYLGIRNPETDALTIRMKSSREFRRKARGENTCCEKVN